jgi:hypothetical protein
MMIDLQPIWHRGLNDWMILPDYDVGVVDRPQVHRNHKSRKARCKCDQHQARLGVAVGRSGFVIEKALKKMTNKMRELTSLWLAHIAQSRLRIQGQNLRPRHRE